MGVISNGTTLLDAGVIDSGIAQGSVTLIKTLTASTSASLSFVHGSSSVVFDGTYKKYIFKLINIHPVNDDSQLNFNVSIDSGSNYNVQKTTTAYNYNHSEGDTVNFGYRTGEDLANGTGFQFTTVGVSNENDHANCVILEIYNPASTSLVKHFLIKGLGVHEDQGTQNLSVAGYANTTSAVNAIQFKMGAGALSTGVIKMYGVN